MDLELTGRAYLITGGTDGLGLALARTLRDEGALVSVCGRNEERLAAARDALGESALVIRTDVTDGNALDQFVDATVEKFGRLDGVVSNAGASSASPVATSNDDQWRADYELKVLPALRLARRSIEHLEKTSGSVLSILSITAKAPPSGSTPTAASRAAGLALMKSMAAEFAPRNVRSNSILIGLIESGQWVRTAERATMELDALYQAITDSQKVPLGRFGRAEEFAALAAFVLSPRASYLTGVGINLDGGLSPVA